MQTHNHNTRTVEEKTFSYRNRKQASFSDIPQALRPRERLIQSGPEALSDRELLAIILNTGIKGKNVLMLAEELLRQLDNGQAKVQALAEIAGLGLSKACLVAAMLEFGRRRWGPAGSMIHHPCDAFSLIRHYADRSQEQFLCLSLNGAHELLAVRVVTLGLVNRTIVHPREVFADPLLDRASAVIVAHNHPSGQLVPSKEDDEITAQLKAAADILGLHLLDHVIFSKDAYYSFSESGRLTV
jgi:DNA repair protein RadC